MVYGTLQRHEADIAIESAVGEGTTVRLSFPVPAGPVTDAETTELVRIVPSLRILLVDDDPLVLKSVRDTLEADSHEVTAAEGGQAGIDAFLAARAGGKPYQVVITDLGMPYVDGRKVASTIKFAAPGTLLLLLTGWGQQLLEHPADRPPHVDAVLSKPPRLRELRRALARFQG
jgi:CheY-like chemotaxis protein